MPTWAQSSSTPLLLVPDLRPMTCWRRNGEIELPVTSLQATRPAGVSDVMTSEAPRGHEATQEVVRAGEAATLVQRRWEARFRAPFAAGPTDPRPSGGAGG